MRRTTFLLLTMVTIISFMISCEEEGTVSNSGSSIAKNFSLSSLDGAKKVELNDFRGKPVVLNFWATWCAPCRKEMPFFQKVWHDYKETGFVLIGIDVQDQKQDAKEFLDKRGISYLNLEDPSGEVASKYGVVGLPATFFIDEKGRIVKKNYGPFLGEDGEKEFINNVEKILK